MNFGLYRYMKMKSLNHQVSHSQVKGLSKAFGFLNVNVKPDCDFKCKFTATQKTEINYQLKPKPNDYNSRGQQF